jgi:hypothetical protein
MAKEEPYPAALLNTVKALKHPFHIATNLGGHTYILSSGQQCSYPVKQGPAKYGKLAYSSAFAYSVPVGSGTLEELGGDNTLALSDDGGETWKCRRDTREFCIEGPAPGWLRSMWYPWKDVSVETWLVPPKSDAPLWHLRVHRIRTSRALTSAEGGFAIYGQRSDGRALEPVTGEAFGTMAEAGIARAASRAGVSGVVDFGGQARKGTALRTDANTNLMVPRAVLPTLLGEHDRSFADIWLVTAVFALPSIQRHEGAAEGWSKEWDKRPTLPREIAALMRV